MIRQWSRARIALMLVLVCVGVYPTVSAAPDVTEVYIPLGGARVMHSAPAAADFNGDGYKEIVVGGSDGMLYVASYNGTSWSKVWSRQTALDLNAANPPHPTATTAIESAPAIADLDNDGHLEIVVTLGGDVSWHLNGGVLVYRYNSAWSFSVVPGWPQPKDDLVGLGAGASNPDGYWDGIYGAPALGDLDGDGDLEIAVEGFDRKIHAWHHNGDYVTGWPIYSQNGDHIMRGGWSSPALGDIDGDGLPEVVVGTDSFFWTGAGYDNTRASVWAFKGDSSVVPGFPVATEQLMQSSVALGDIDGDGKLEIVVGSGLGLGGTGGYKVYAWKGDGTVVNNWPRPTAGNMPSSPALADLDGDGDLEVIIGCGAESDQSCQYLYAWHGDGTSVSGFPMQPLDANPWPGGHQPHAQPYAPIVADIDGDSHPEILMVMSNSIGISIVRYNGAMSSDYSRIQDHGYDVIVAPPLVEDVDNDGLLETVVAGKGDNDQAAVYIWNETAMSSAQRPWPMVRHDVRRTGRYMLSPQLAFPSELRFFHQQGSSGTIEVQTATLQNLGDGTFDWSIADPIGNLQVSPLSGTVSVQATLQFTLNTTGYLLAWTNLGMLTVSGKVGSNHVRSSPMTVPVRLYVGDVARLYLPITLRGD